MAPSHRTQDTRHSATAHRPKGLPVRGERPRWGKHAEGPPPEAGGRAAQQDRDDRAAYDRAIRSAYLQRVALPPRVAPGDVREARAILGRIEGCLLDGERYTKLEKRRLRDMREAWERRAGGRDVEFQLAGWVKRRENERQRAARSDARKFAEVMEALNV